MRVELRLGDNLGRARVNHALSSKAEHAHRRILLFVSPPGSISDAMSAAIEREFSWISVIHVSEPQMACEKFDSDVQLIIVDHSLFNVFQTHCGRLSEIHPFAMTAVMTEARPEHVEQLVQIIEARAVRGILPNNVNLDIWLSIVRIMLKGGEYFPHGLFQPSRRPQVNDRTVLIDRRSHLQEQREQGSTLMNELTARELEILAMVARGNQNKIIASDLGLSEHTIKIHLHNIIRKLGVHNRTEAAAWFYDYSHNSAEDPDNEADREQDDYDGRERDQSGKRSSPPSD